MNIDRKTTILLIEQLRFMNGTVLSNANEKHLTTCIKCFHFNESAEICKLANARPPARIIAFGCDSYEKEDEIPY